ncbi:hypothetical protein, partial [Prevotellamassilia timonensis]|uniref:hypothetical protein n=2 Tax=Prevotellamassilia timonensis TaxID=1852370 RepID=UPI00307A56ED
ATTPTRDTQGAASLALGYVLHWAFSPPLLNQKFEMLNRMLRFYKIKAASFLRRVSRLLKKTTRDASPPLELALSIRLTGQKADLKPWEELLCQEFALKWGRRVSRRDFFSSHISRVFFCSLGTRRPH